jgi:hypothetical protein
MQPGDRLVVAFPQTVKPGETFGVDKLYIVSQAGTHKLVEAEVRL